MDFSSEKKSDGRHKMLHVQLIVRSFLPFARRRDIFFAFAREKNNRKSCFLAMSTCTCDGACALPKNWQTDYIYFCCCFMFVWKKLDYINNENKIIIFSFIIFKICSFNELTVQKSYFWNNKVFFVNLKTKQTSKTMIK